MKRCFLSNSVPHIKSHSQVLRRNQLLKSIILKAKDFIYTIMKHNFIILMIISLIILSCQKESNKISEQYKNSLSNQIDTTIFSSDTLQVSFGYFGDEEGISIISPPKNSKFCKLINKPWEERILRYIPLDNFLGTDSVSIITMKGSDGASPSADIDTILVLINVIKNDFHKLFIGKWDWIGSCGGYTGGCWYPDSTNKLQVEFTSDMHYIQFHNDSVVNNFTYYFIDSFNNGETTIFEIGFSTDLKTFLWFSDGNLNIQGGDFVEEYKKIR
jgi:hypothetical protein